MKLGIVWGWKLNGHRVWGHEYIVSRELQQLMVILSFVRTSWVQKLNYSLFTQKEAQRGSDGECGVSDTLLVLPLNRYSHNLCWPQPWLLNTNNEMSTKFGSIREEISLREFFLPFSLERGQSVRTPRIGAEVKYLIGELLESLPSVDCIYWEAGPLCWNAALLSNPLDTHANSNHPRVLKCWKPEHLALPSPLWSLNQKGLWWVSLVLCSL